MVEVKIRTESLVVRDVLAVAWDALADRTPGAPQTPSEAVTVRAGHLCTHLGRAVGCTEARADPAEERLLTALSLRIAALRDADKQGALFARFVELIGSTYDEEPRRLVVLKDDAVGDGDPMAWISCLAAYNAGHLHGRWVNLSTEDVDEAIAEVLGSSPVEDAEEYQICDYESMPALGRYAGLDELREMADAIEQYGAEIVTAANGVFGDDYAIEALEAGAYQGEYESGEDWAHEYLESTGALASMPENLRYYFDYARYVNDCECEGMRFVYVSHNRTLVFDPNVC